MSRVELVLHIRLRGRYGESKCVRSDNIWDSVDLTMRFSLELPDGTEVFRATLSQAYSTRYRTCCARDAPPAFLIAFEAVFRQLAKRLVESDIKLDP